MKPAHRIAVLLVSAFGIGVLAGHGVNLRDSHAEGYLDMITKPSAVSPTGELPGYRNLIPGYLPKTAPEKAAAGAPMPQVQRDLRGAVSLDSPAPVTFNFLDPAEARPNAGMSWDPRLAEKKPPARVADFTFGGFERPLDVDWSGFQIAPELQKAVDELIRPKGHTIIPHPRARVRGMLPEEQFNEARIGNLLKAVRNPTLSPQEKKAGARQAAEELTRLKNGLYARERMPSDLFVRLGIPDIYMQEEHEAVSKSITRADRALQELRRYE